MEREGIIRFAARHTHSALDADRYAASVRALDAWRSVWVALGGIGRSDDRYGGLGFGNASVRVPPFSSSRGSRAFVVTASQTGALARVSVRDVALVSRWSLVDFALESEGVSLPSSEALTHAAVYDAGPSLRAVIHVHMPEIAKRARALGLPSTTKSAAYGTREMADEVHRLFRETTVDEGCVFTMEGHEDGVVAVGRSLDEAGHALVDALVRARRA